MISRPAAVASSGPAAADVESTLRRYQALTRSALLRYLPAKEPARHLYDLLPVYPLQGGKGIRPALCLATCRAYGKRLDAALPAAVALELLHNAFLVHDDIQDGSVRRRRRPTLNVTHGVPLALNAGDALAFLSVRPLLHEGLGRLARPILDEFMVLAQETLEGQAMELGWIRDNVADVTVADYLRMTAKKTSWYTVVAPCRMGALIGSGGRARLEGFVAFGFFLGAAFQIGDDLIGIGADRGADNDLFEGKRTLMLIHLLDHATAAERDRLVRFLGQSAQGRREEGADWVALLMVEHGSIDFARSCLKAMTAAATAAFEAAFGHLHDSVHKEFLRQLVPFVARRTG